MKVALERLARVRVLAPLHLPIAYKLALVISLLTAGGMATLGTVIINNQSDLFRKQMNRFGETIARQMAEAAKEPLLADDPLTLTFIVNNFAANEHVLGAAVYNDEGERVAAAGTIPEAALGRSGNDTTRLEWRTGSAEDGRPVASFLSAVQFEEVTAGYVQLTFGRSLMETSLNDGIRAVLVATVAMILLGIAASMVLSKRMARPINDLMLATAEISRGNYHIRFEERRNDELGTLMQAFQSMSEGLLRKDQVEQVFSCYLSPKVAHQILSDIEHVSLGGKHVHATVLFADIVGFTRMSETMTPSEINTLLNECFGYVAEAAHCYQGHIDKFMGDCAMIVFGVPEEDDDHPYHAICCAVMIQRLARIANEKRRGRGLPPVEFRIGVNSGEMLAGNMGSYSRMEYTVVGDAVNLASRLSTSVGAGDIVITEQMHTMLNERYELDTRLHGTIALRGKSLPVRLYEVLDIDQEEREQMGLWVQEIVGRREAA